GAAGHEAEPPTDRRHAILRAGEDRRRHRGADRLAQRPDRQDALQGRREPDVEEPCTHHVLSGRGKFQNRRVVDGGLEISVSVPTDDERLREWILESRTVLPRLQAMVRNGARGATPPHYLVEDLRRRVEELEEEVARLRRDLASI